MNTIVRLNEASKMCAGDLCFRSISYQSFQFSQTLLSENCMLNSFVHSVWPNGHPEVFM